MAPLRSLGNPDISPFDDVFAATGKRYNHSTQVGHFSVEFDGSDWLDIADHADFTFGTSDFTIECWYKTNNLSGLSNSFDYIFAAGWPIQLAHTNGSSQKITFYMKDTASGGSGTYVINDLNTGTGSITSTSVWYHIAVTRDSNTFRMFLDGVLKDTATSSTSAPAPGEASSIGRFSPASPYYYANGTVSNFRYIKGTALYTSAFTPPTNGLTNVTNTKLLCCNTSTTTGSTVTPGTITANGDPTASSSNPF